MPYFVKWKLHGQDKVFGSKFPYADPETARDFACGALVRKPSDIWIEDERGIRIDEEIAIIRHCANKKNVVTFRPVVRSPRRPRPATPER